MTVDSNAAGRNVIGRGTNRGACPDSRLAQRVPALAAGSLAACLHCRCKLAADTGCRLDAVPRSRTAQAPDSVPAHEFSHAVFDSTP